MGEKRPLPKPAPHAYDDVVVTGCSPDEAFGMIMEEGMSAPGAPAARPGTTEDITLLFDNPITQVVDVTSRTIINTTQQGHAFHPGDVRIKVAPLTGNRSRVSIHGRGTGKEPLLNILIGKAWFGAMLASLAVSCATEELNAPSDRQ